MKRPYGPPQQTPVSGAEPEQQVNYNVTAPSQRGMAIHWEVSPGQPVSDESLKLRPLGVPNTSTEDVERAAVIPAAASGSGTRGLADRSAGCYGNLSRRACVILIVTAALLAVAAVAGGAVGIALAATKDRDNTPPQVDSTAPGSLPSPPPGAPAESLADVCNKAAAINYNDTAGTLLLVDVVAETGVNVTLAECCRNCAEFLGCNLFAFCDPGVRSIGCGAVRSCDMFVDEYPISFNPPNGKTPECTPLSGQWPRGTCTLKKVSDPDKLAEVGGSDATGWVSSVFTP